MGLLIVLVVVFIFGYLVGRRRGGEYHLQRLSDTEHEIRRSRAGLGKR